MVPVASRPLTKLGFRRDVKLFLGALVGYLVVVNLVLLLALQQAMIRTQEATAAARETIVRVATQELDRLPPASSPNDVRAVLGGIRTRFALQGIELSGEGGELSAGFTQGVALAPVERDTSRGTIRLFFDDSDLQGERTRFNRMAVICIAGTVLITLLYVLYVRRILQPIETMLGDAAAIGEKGDLEESHYLIETFRSSIETLQRQERELKRLHDLEKARADELELVTSTLTRSLTSGFLAADREGRVVTLNRAGREILGIGEEEVTAFDDLPDCEFRRLLQSSFAERRAVSRAETTAGERQVGVTIVMLESSTGSPIGMLALFTDLTPVRSLERRMRELQALADLGEMAAGIAHEFRNSLTTVLGYLKLARRAELTPEVSARIAAAEEESSSLARAVSALLQFAGPMETQLVPTRLDRLVGLLAERFTEEHEDISFVFDAEPVSVLGDESLLRRLFENLLLNAVDAVRAGDRDRRVEVVVGGDSTPFVTVADSGAGIDEPEPERLFLPFQSRKPQGFGLGLALARKIALLHNGELTLANRPEGGAVATLRFSEAAERDLP